MAKKKSRYNVKNGNGYDQLLFETVMSQVIDAPIKSLERSTAYKENDICCEATLPKGGFLICTTAGTTTNTVPTAFSTAVQGATITDGTAKFTVHYFEQLVSFNNVFSGSTSSSSGTSGIVPAPNAGEENKVLCANGAWELPIRTVNGQAPDSGGNVEVALNDLSGTLPLAKGGTGATTALDAVKALLGSGNVGSDATPIYYSNGKLVAGNYTFRLNHNTSDTWIPVFSSGAIDYVLKSEIASAWTGGGIVAANLNTNGYVKFANGLILQWGRSHASKVIQLPLSVTETYCALTEHYGSNVDVNQIIYEVYNDSIELDTPNINVPYCYTAYWLHLGR